MREIQYAVIARTIKQLFIKANRFLPPSTAKLLDDAAGAERDATARSVLHKLAENREIAEKTGIPLCQDTGMAFVFAEIGQDTHITGGLFSDAVNDGVAAAYTEGYLRKSVVDPLTRENTGDNTPAVIYINMTAGDRIKLTAVPKGFGSENMSRLKMFNPTSREADIIDFVRDTVVLAGGRPCPPLVVGVGIGGSFDYAPVLAKKALARCGKNPDERGAVLERKILKALNATGVGAEGLGGDITALSVAVETFPTHIAALPVAVNVSCHATRHAEAVI